MQLVARIERTQESKSILERTGPISAQYWEDYRDLEPMLSEKHSTALYLADQAFRRSEKNKRFNTDVSQAAIDSFVIQAPTVLRKLDKDTQSIISAGGQDAVVYLKTLSTLRANLTETITHFQRLVGI